MLIHKGLQLSLANGSIMFGEKTIELTKNELKILSFLIKNKSNIVSREELMEYLWSSDYYNNLLKNLEGLDRKYLLSEIITEPEFMDGKILYEIITVTNRDMLEHIKEFSEQQREYKKYIESWVHEIKTPIACGKLINGKDITKMKVKDLEERNLVLYLKILRKIGVEEGIINKSIFIQTTIYFFTPLGLALIHSIIGAKNIIKNSN
ncbi:winged helix-turn-helix domain-containing protein [Clostridium akagii]|uniref:winged helix-turn-helix domain-containing protein n=1 Tax=Clostridium akagii TaxID=91623 RepID=UPI003BF98C10